MTLLGLWKRAAGNNSNNNNTNNSSHKGDQQTDPPQSSSFSSSTSPFPSTIPNVSTSLPAAATSSSSSALSVSAKYWLRQYYISLEEPHRLYKPGEVISGQLIIELKRDCPTIIIDLILLGDIKIKVKNSTGTGLKSLKPMNFLHKSTIIYGQHEAGKDVGLTKGIHYFPFNLKLPTKSKKLFNEIKFERGGVDYYLKSTIRILNKENILSSCSYPFHVFLPLDVGPYATKPRNKTVILQSSVNSLKLAGGGATASTILSDDIATSSIFTQSSTHSSTYNNVNGTTTTTTTGDEPKTVRISVSIPQSGYTIGELIPITINLQHYKDYFHSSGVIITLVRICRVGSMESMNMETFRKDVCQTVSPLFVDDSTQYSFNKTIPLHIPPDIFATISTRNKLNQELFDFTYYIEVLVNLSRKNQIITNNNTLLSNTLSELDSNISSSPTSHFHLNAPHRLLTSSSSLSSSPHAKLFRNKLLPMLLDNDDTQGNHDSNSNRTVISTLPPPPHSMDVDTLFAQDQTIFNDNDMINVETLKRQRNVTGMSIEIVIGNTRSQKHPHHQSLSQEQQRQQPQHQYSLPDTLPSYTPPSDITQQRLLDQSIQRNEDKQDLEREALQQLESEPPDMY